MRKRPAGNVILLPAGEIKRLKTRQTRRLRAARQQAQFRRGFDRTGGFFGRFAQGQELKFHDLDIDDAVVAGPGTIARDSCNLIAQGVTESQRVGRKCTIRAIGWRWDIALPNTATVGSTSDVVRVVLYLDKQANGAIATVTGILKTDDYQSFNNLANKGRFRTLMDRTYSFSATAGSGRGSTDTLSFGENRIIDNFFKKVTIPIEFSGSTGALTELRSNNIGVLLLSKSGLCAFTSKMRIRFADL